MSDGMAIACLVMLAASLTLANLVRRDGSRRTRRKDGGDGGDWWDSDDGDGGGDD